MNTKIETLKKKFAITQTLIYTSKSCQDVARKIRWLLQNLEILVVRQQEICCVWMLKDVMNFSSSKW